MEYKNSYTRNHLLLKAKNFAEEENVMSKCFYKSIDLKYLILKNR